MFCFSKQIWPFVMNPMYNERSKEQSSMEVHQKFAMATTQIQRSIYKIKLFIVMPLPRDASIVVEKLS